jgi:hypothetical protein
MDSFLCTSCHGLEKPLTEDELCADCYEKFKVDVFFIGKWDDAAKDNARETLMRYSPAERAHGLVFVDGVFRFARDPMVCRIFEVNPGVLDKLAVAQHVAPCASSRLWHRRFYRGLGYSLQGYADIFGSEFLYDDEEE